jgi:Cytochrome P450
MAPSLTAGLAALPRGPRGHAVLGSLRDFSRDQLGFYARSAREYGDVVPVRLGPFPGLLIYHPDAIEEVLVVRNRDFIKSRGVRLMRAFLGDGLFTAEEAAPASASATRSRRWRPPWSWPRSRGASVSR